MRACARACVVSACVVCCVLCAVCCVAWGELRALQTGHAGDMPTVDFDEFTVLACTKSAVPARSASPLSEAHRAWPLTLRRCTMIASRVARLSCARFARRCPHRHGCALLRTARHWLRVLAAPHKSQRGPRRERESWSQGSEGTRVLTVGVRLVGMQRSIARHTNKPAPTATLRSGGSRRKSAQRVRG